MRIRGLQVAQANNSLASICIPRRTLRLAISTSSRGTRLYQPQLAPKTSSNNLFTSTSRYTIRSSTRYTSTPEIMSSDDAYASFLDKANEDPSSGSAKTASTKKAGTKSVNASIPKSLEQIEEYYTSDADEPFEPVSLSYDGKSLPSAKQFGELVGKKAEKISQKDFDPQGSYGKVVDTVKSAGSAGQVGYYSVELGGTRTEYFVVSVDDGEGRLVGLKAVAVES